MVKIEVGKRDFARISLLIVLLGVGLVHGYNSVPNPSVFGHTASEILIDDTFCKKVTGHNCGAIGDESVGGDLDLVYGLHSSVQCKSLGGDIVADGSSLFCRFDVPDSHSATCPSGWTQYKEYSATSSTYLRAYDSEECQLSNEHSYTTFRGYLWRCSTGAHSFSNKNIESCIPGFCAIVGDKDSAINYLSSCTSSVNLPNYYLCDNEYYFNSIPATKPVDPSMSGGAVNAIITELGCY